MLLLLSSSLPSNEVENIDDYDDDDEVEEEEDIEKDDLESRNDPASLTAASNSGSGSGSGLFGWMGLGPSSSSTAPSSAIERVDGKELICSICPNFEVCFISLFYFAFSFSILVTMCVLQIFINCMLHILHFMTLRCSTFMISS